MVSLSADRSILEYQLGVAIKYGDALRANQIQSELNDNTNKAIALQADISKATQDSSRALTGNSDAAIKNRQTMQGLVTSSIDYLVALKTTTKDTKTLISNATSMKSDFIDQAKAMGFSEKELTKYAGSFDDFIKIIKNTSDKIDLPMKVYLGFDGADAALHKWKEDNKVLNVKIKVDNPDYLAYVAGISADELQAYRVAKDAIKNNVAALKNADTKARYLRTISDFETKYGKGFSTGGLVTGLGSSTSDSINARLSNGEFVINAAAVNRVGVGFLNAINNQQSLPVPARTMQVSAPSSTSNVVYLSPDDRALLRAAIDRPVNLYTENTKIAQSANEGNVLLARRGKN